MIERASSNTQQQSLPRQEFKWYQHAFAYSTGDLSERLEARDPRAAAHAEAMAPWRRRAQAANASPWPQLARIAAVALMASLLSAPSEGRETRSLRSGNGMRVVAQVGDTMTEVIGSMGVPQLQRTGPEPALIYMIDDRVVEIRLGPGGVVSGIDESRRRD